MARWWSSSAWSSTRRPSAGKSRLACDDLPGSPSRRMKSGEIQARCRLGPGLRGQPAVRDRPHPRLRHRARPPLRLRRHCHGPARHRRRRNPHRNFSARSPSDAANGNRLGRRASSPSPPSAPTSRPTASPWTPTASARTPASWAWLALFFIVAAVPFTCAGVAVVAALRHRPSSAGATYGASLAGSAAGAALAVPLLAQVGSAATVLLAAALALAAPLIAAPRLPAIGSAFLAVALLGTAFVIAPAGPRVSVHSQLAQALQRPDARHLDTQLSSNSRVDVLHNAGFRTATGLSLNYSGSVPRPRLGLTIDGGNAAALDVPVDPGSRPRPRHPRRPPAPRRLGLAPRSHRRIRRRRPAASRH